MNNLQLLAFFIPSIYVFIYFIFFVWKRSNKFTSIGLLFQIVSIMVFPLLFWFFINISIDQGNDCCNDKAFFSPNHAFSIWILIIICIAAYFLAILRKELLPPLAEICVNCFLLIGIVINILMICQIPKELLYPMLPMGFLPIILWFIIALLKSHRLFFEKFNRDTDNDNTVVKISSQILSLSPLKKYPLLLILCLPLLVILSSILLLFGQKPDSFIQAFTDTYNHGLSLHNCEGVNCYSPPQNDFLCTIAAKGHKKFVKPVREGLRQNENILVNRQLLISNAFEELLQEKLPWLHKPLREIYNVIGRNATRLYNILGNKWVSDVVYILLKPLEWFFLLALYLFSSKPENRIASQYLSVEERKAIKIKLKLDFSRSSK